MSARLKQWMATTGLSNSELARELNFTREFVWQVANGRRDVTGEFRWRFAERFGWDEAQALFGADAPATEIIIKTA